MALSQTPPLITSTFIPSSRPQAGQQPPHGIPSKIARADPALAMLNEMLTPLTDSTVPIHLHSSSARLDRQDERLDSSLPGIPSNIAGADPVALWNRLLSPQGVVQMMAINTLNVSIACADDGHTHSKCGKQNTFKKERKIFSYYV